MELRLTTLRGWRSDEIDWPAAAIAGLAAGGVLMVLEMAWAASGDAAGAWRHAYLVAALVLGPGILHDAAPPFDIGIVAIALATHYVLGIAFALVLAAIVTRWQGRTSAGLMPQLVGAGFGLVLYLVNFHGLTHVFPWLAELRGWSTVIAHLVFGIGAALLYWKLARPQR